MSRRSAALIFWAFAMAGCNGGTSPLGGGTGVNGGALSIAVAAVTQPAAIGGVHPASGRRFVAVDATLTNGSGSAESIAFALFAVQTASGLRVQAAPVTSQLIHACAADQSLAPGGATTCSLAFEVPTAEMATMLMWLDPRTMASSTATLPQPTTPTLESACEQAMTQQNRSSMSCDTCVRQCISSSDVCTSSDYGCIASCSGDMGSATICHCIVQCPLTDGCRQQIIANVDCQTVTCAAQCD
jgi:hypothetical protein